MAIRWLSEPHLAGRWKSSKIQESLGQRLGVSTSHPREWRFLPEQKICHDCKLYTNKQTKTNSNQQSKQASKLAEQRVREKETREEGTKERRNEGRKEGRKVERKEEKDGRKEGRKEERKRGRKEGRKEGRKNKTDARRASKLISQWIIPRPKNKNRIEQIQMKLSSLLYS